jgi:hypothetical protein
MRKLLFLLLFLVFQLSVLCQVHTKFAQAKIDSLQRLLQVSGINEQVTILNAIASYYAPGNFDSSIMYASQAIRLATTRTNNLDVALVKVTLGNVYYYRMDFKNALISYLSAQPKLEEGKQYNKLAELCMMLGHINFFIMRSDMAVSYYQKAMENFKAAGNDASPAEVLYALTLVYWRVGSFDSALFYGQKYLSYAREHKNRLMEAAALIYIGMIYIDDSSFFYNGEALKIAKELKNNNLVGVIYNNIASNYDMSSPLFKKQGDLKLARYYYNLAYKAARKANYNVLLAMTFNSLAAIDIMEGKYSQAISNLDHCQAALQAFVQFPEMQPEAVIFYAFDKIIQTYLALRTRNDMYANYFELAMKTGKYQDAVMYQRLYQEAGDSLNAVQQGRQLELLMAEAESEKTDQKIRILSQDNELNQLRLSRSRFIFAGAGAGVLIISLSLLLYFQRKKLKAEQKSIAMEQRLLRAQMNPHFLFNSLASIQNYIINEKTDQASLYLSRFSQLVRNVLDNSAEEYVSVENEFDAIENYLELQKVRYAGKLDYRMTVDELIDQENTLIPPMLAQPFIENAIEHGIKHKESEGNINIRFILEDGLIRFEVEDNGVGREKAAEIEHRQKSHHRSMSTSITQDRLLAINKKLRKKIRMEIIDLVDQSGEACGTKVTFGIPVVVK